MAYMLDLEHIMHSIFYVYEQYFKSEIVFLSEIAKLLWKISELQNVFLYEVSVSEIEM